MDNIIINTITSSDPAYAEVFALREAVLRQPLGMSLHNEDLSLDHINTIFTGSHEGRVIACLMLNHKDADKVQLRQMAVYPEYQGKGVGRMLVQAAEQHAKEKGYKTMILHARKTATGFYQSMNYTLTSSEFVEVGISHYIMEKELGR